MKRIHGLIGYRANRTWCGRADVNCIVAHDPLDSSIDCKTCLRWRYYWLIEKRDPEAGRKSRLDNAT